MFIANVAAALSILSFLPVLAVELSAPIVGCSDVDCPTASGVTSAECRVADRTFSLIGIAKFDTSIADDDFTWTQGIQAYDNNTIDPKVNDPEVNDSRTYERNFYLGSPQGFNLVENARSAGYGACALFFTKIAPEVKFEGDQRELAVGTCEDALGSECVNAWVKQGADAMRFNRTTTRPCETLLSEIRGNVVSQCPYAADDEFLQGLKVIDLTGSDAPKPFTEAQNSTSNCHPTLPKTNSLTRVAAFNRTGSSLVDSVADNIYSITPILTVFFPRNGSNSSLIKEPEARLTCLKSAGLTDAELATLSPTDANTESDENKEGAANVLTSPKLVMLGLATIFSAMIVM